MRGMLACVWTECSGGDSGGTAEEALLELRRRWQSSVGTRSQKAVSLEEAASVGCCKRNRHQTLRVLSACCFV